MGRDIVDLNFLGPRIMDKFVLALIIMSLYWNVGPPSLTLKIEFHILIASISSVQHVAVPKLSLRCCRSKNACGSPYFLSNVYNLHAIVCKLCPIAIKLSAQALSQPHGPSVKKFGFSLASGWLLD